MNIEIIIYILLSTFLKTGLCKGFILEIVIDSFLWVYLSIVKQRNNYSIFIHSLPSKNMKKNTNNRVKMKLIKF